MKIYDKAAWQIDNGMPKDLVVSHFKKIFIWLNDNELLSDEGKEIYEFGIDDSISLHERMIDPNVPEALEFFDTEYDKYIMANEYGTDENCKVLDVLYTEYKSSKCKGNNTTDDAPVGEIIAESSPKSSY